MKAPPLKLQNRFEELSIYDTSENVATGSNHVTSLKGVMVAPFSSYLIAMKGEIWASGGKCSSH